MMERMRIKRLASVACLIAVALSACSKGSSSQASSGPNGESVYIANCASCHQPNGRGLIGTFPPLAGSAIADGDPASVIRIVKHGRTGPLVVSGKPYNGMMPAWSPTLSDDAIATVLTYVRSSWGNHAAAITASEVGTSK